MFFFREGSIRHYHIKLNQKPNVQYYLAEKHLFKDIPDLIGYHQHNAAGNVTQMQNPNKYKIILR